LDINYNPAGPVAESFHKSNAFIRGLMGPVGSSKSSACCLEIFTRACEQKPFNGVRKSIWGAVRNTYGELETTTLRTWMQWFPFAKITHGSPITSIVDLPLPDGTRVNIETWFFPLDRPDDVKKLRSLEATGFWLNEVSEISKDALDMCTQRVGRYPPMREGGATWYGVMMDTNPPDTDHWYWKLAETERPEGWEFFKQPGGLIYKGGNYLERSSYEPNPLAENIPNLPGGYEYYYKQIAGKSWEWIKVFVLGQYGAIVSGRPVYPEYNDDIHCAKQEFNPVPGLPLIIGFDYGLTPAAVICQLTPRGQLLVIDELTSNGMGIRQFARDALKPHIANNYPQWKNNIQCVGDPAGMKRSDTDERTCFMELADEGFICMPALTNDVLARLEAVKKFLTRMADGKPGILVSPRAQKIRKGFLGKYCFERVQVTGKEIYRDKPVKNDYSHCHDALQYVSMYVNHVELSSWRETIDTKPRVAMI
jgi:hypothetical protein